MKTFVTVIFSSEGEKPSEIESRLFGIGLQAIHGQYDFFYDWEKEPSIDEVMMLIDSLQAALDGTKVLFSVETV
jgi:hypothetical protein